MFHPPVGQQIAAVTAHRPEALPKSESTQPRCTTTMVTLYVSRFLKEGGIQQQPTAWRDLTANTLQVAALISPSSAVAPFSRLVKSPCTCSFVWLLFPFSLTARCALPFLLRRLVCLPRDQGVTDIGDRPPQEICGLRNR